jgi:hypothetical protein
MPMAAVFGGATGLRDHAWGTARDSEDTLAFSSLQGVKPMIETLPLERAAEGYEKMMDGDARFWMRVSSEVTSLYECDNAESGSKGPVTRRGSSELRYGRPG